MVGLAAARIDARMARYTPAKIAGPGKKDAAAMIAAQVYHAEECRIDATITASIGTAPPSSAETHFAGNRAIAQKKCHLWGFNQTSDARDQLFFLIVYEGVLEIICHTKKKDWANAPFARNR